MESYIFALFACGLLFPRVLVIRLYVSQSALAVEVLRRAITSSSIPLFAISRFGIFATECRQLLRTIQSFSWRKRLLECFLHSHLSLQRHLCTSILLRRLLLSRIAKCVLSYLPRAIFLSFFFRRFPLFFHLKINLSEFRLNQIVLIFIFIYLF